jgi:hypothetical protein
MKLSINFDDDSDFCYFAHEAESGECWNMPESLANIDEAIAFIHREYPQAEISIGDSAQEG